jgi:hypothetical protein
MTLTGKNRSTQETTCPNAALYTTNPIRIGLGLITGLRGEGPAMNHLSHGTALKSLCPTGILTAICVEHGLVTALAVLPSKLFSVSG